jgi:DNA-binding NtrC family response regulator
MPLCRRPVREWVREAPPPAAPDGGTFLIRDLQQLSLHEQRNLLAWLNERPARVQMVGVTHSALFPLVDGAGFLDALYYRLNTLYIDADDLW